MKVYKSEKSNGLPQTSNDVFEQSIPENKFEREPFETSAISTEWVLGQVAFKILLEGQSVRYAKCLAEASRDVRSGEIRKFKNKEDVIEYAKKILDKYLLDKYVVLRDEGKLHDEREKFDHQKLEKEEKLKRQILQFENDKKDFLAFQQDLNKERDQLDSDLKKGAQELEKLRLEIINQETELAKVRERFQKEQRTLAEKEKLIKAEQEKQAQHALVAEKEAKKLEQMIPWQRVNLRAKEVRLQLSQEDITHFLTHVYRGNLKEVEKFLNRDKKLVAAQGDITDLSGREFKQITGFQYAYWAMDVEMCELILRYMLPREAWDQWFEIRAGDIFDKHGAHFSLVKYLESLKEYIDNYDAWNKNCENGGREAIEHCWFLEVGGAQRDFPAWMIMMMCEEGMEVAWLRQDLTLGFERDEEYLNGWFCYEEMFHLGGILMSGPFQDDSPEAIAGFSWGRGRRCRVRPWNSPPFGWMLEADYQHAFRIELVRQEALVRLQTALCDLVESESVTPKKGMKNEIIVMECERVERQINLARVKQKWDIESQKFEEDLARFENKKNSIALQSEGLVQSRKQLQHQLEVEKQILEAMRFEIEVQEEYLALEKELKSLQERQINEAREKQARQALMARKQAEALKPMTPGQRVNLLGMKAEKHLDQSEIILFLKQVYRGNLEEVEKILIANKNVASAQSDITDLSGREFKKITGFQYAYWALDVEMCELILKYLPLEEARDQLVVLENERADILKAHGTHFSFHKYLTALKKLLDNYKSWVKSYEGSGKKSMVNCWCIEVGGSERSFPAWMIMFMSKDGAEVGWVKQGLRPGCKEEMAEIVWVKQELRPGLKRDAKYLERWFDFSDTQAWLHVGSVDVTLLSTYETPLPHANALPAPSWYGFLLNNVSADHQRVFKIEATRLRALDILRQKLCNSVESVSISLGKSGYN